MNLPIKLGKLIKCRGCEVEFRTGRQHNTNALYCSRDCWKKHWKGENTHMFGRVARNRGVKMSEETRLKMSLAKKGKISPTKGMKRSDIVGDKHPMWKGGNSKGYKLGITQQTIKIGEHQSLKEINTLAKTVESKMYI